MRYLFVLLFSFSAVTVYSQKISFFSPFEGANLQQALTGWNPGTSPHPQSCITKLDTINNNGAPPLRTGGSGTGLLQFGTTAYCASFGQDSVHSKLYKSWPIDSPNTTFLPGPPIVAGDESGSYSAWFYIPTDYVYPTMAGGLVMLLAFKEDYLSNGIWYSDAQHQFSLTSQQEARYYTGQQLVFPGRQDAPVIFVSRHQTQHKAYMLAPLGKWFKLTMRVYARKKIQFLVNDSLFDEQLHVDYPVGIRETTPDFKPTGWTLTIGHYGQNVGHLWMDDVKVDTLLKPVANAGADTTILLPVNQVVLNGSRSFDPDGKITSYKWTIVSSVQATINNPSSATPTITNLKKGNYTFNLLVTDNDGFTSSDTVTVTVAPKK